MLLEKKDDIICVRLNHRDLGEYGGIDLEIRDHLTGLLRKKAFDDDVRQMLDTHEDMEFELLRMDVERFLVVNEFFGE